MQGFATCHNLELRKLIGLADCCELAARVFMFPDEQLAEALADGTILADSCSCMADAGLDDAVIARVKAELRPLLSETPSRLCENLRREYSLMYLAPGAEVPVWPYESAFLHVKGGKKGAPILFRSPVALDVEAQMRACGVRADNDRREPCDSVWNELSFLSFLYGSAARALYDADDGALNDFLDAAGAFEESHARQWFPAFFEETEKVSSNLEYGAHYAAFARLVDESARALRAM